MSLLRASLLKSEPAGSLGSLDEMFALAYAMEQEAATKYGELVDEMRRQNKVDLAEVFTQLAAAERDHVDSVTRWSQSRRGKAPDPNLVRWEAPETLDPDAAAEVKTSRLMTPYRALAMAVRNEERAFAFWSYLAAYSDDAEVKNAAEAMAREELGHVAILRRERRRAYHQEHAPDATDRLDVAGSESERRQSGQIDARTLELRLASLIARLERRFDGPAAKRAQELQDETIAMANNAVTLGGFPAKLEEGDALTIAEALADGYLNAAEGAGDPARLETWQALAERAIGRLAWLRSLEGGAYGL
jgi:rubrerythrin